MFQDFPEAKCKSISREEREAQELANRSLVYGEVVYETIEEILSVVGNNTKHLSSLWCDEHE